VAAGRRTGGEGAAADGEGAEGVRLEVRISAAARRRELEEDVRRGLGGVEKSLPPNWFYDDEGSRLFEAITRLEEYYPTRTEAAILTAHAGEIAGRSRARALAELGSGLSEKTLLLLDALAGDGRLERISTLDVCEEVLRDAAAALHARYGVAVHAVVGDFRRDLGALPREGRRLVCFLGGTIGNFAPAARQRFLVDLEATMAHDDYLLLGTDLVKEPARLVAAYDDEAGVTAAFNRNLLVVLNRELGGDFDPAAFDHVALWNEKEHWIEMHLRARRAQRVRLAALDLTVSFAEGESLLTEISAKFTPDGIGQELAAANFVVEERFTDPRGDFLLTLARPYC